MTITIGAVPNEGSTLLGAVHWLEALVQGPAATTLAVLAVASTGLMMLTGRLAVRRGLVVAIGCFILFGAPAIARGIMGSATALASAEPAASPPPPPLAVPAFNPTPPPPPPAAADPYAGASVER